MLLQQEISYQNNLQKVGQKLKVIIDAKMNDYYIGRTQHDSPEIDNEVIIKSDKKIKIGDFIDVLINNAEEFDIFAEY
jgi:ribosomal protein S12 methylthiotransferase